MTKPTREWCSKERTFIKDTTKKRIRCEKCGRLLVVITNGWGEEPVGAQFIGPHKGKYNA